MPERTSQQGPPVTYQASYDSARAAVLNYPRRAIRMQLGRLATRARTEAQWGFVDALADLLREAPNDDAGPDC